MIYIGEGAVRWMVCCEIYADEGWLQHEFFTGCQFIT